MLHGVTMILCGVTVLLQTGMIRLPESSSKMAVVSGRRPFLGTGECSRSGVSLRKVRAGQLISGGVPAELFPRWRFTLVPGPWSDFIPTVLYS